MSAEEDTTTSAASTAAAEEARAKAEARRRRILEKSGQRMGIVSGEQVKSTTKQEDDDTAAAPTEPASSGSSRMQAMRRRRFAKKKQDEAAAASTATTTTTEEEETTDDQKPAAVETKTDKKTDEPVAVVAETVVETVAVEQDDGAVKEKKKYKGVAAMRRQKLKERAAKESSERSEEITKRAPLLKKKAVIYKIPVILHLLTIILMFSAGLLIGLNQVVEETVTVHRETLAPHQHGIGIMNYIEKKRAASKDPKEALLEEQDDWAKEANEVADEFDTKDDEEEYVPNIDPLFQLDLDKFTQGNSVFMIVARFAVSIHRLNLYFCYYLPIRILNSLWRIPAKLLNTPPLMFLFALIVRQFSKRVLGAGLPEEPPEAKKEDVLAMIKNAVTGFLSSSFPTAVGLYDAFTHLRSDMFVMLCGVFIGLAANHHLGEGQPPGYSLLNGGAVHEEL